MFRFGVDYYPEHWPEKRWASDARLMQSAGMNTVRLAEFAWSYLEPEPGHYDFAWLDRALGVLQDHGIQAVLGTPTASPPPWVMAMHPEAYLVDSTAQRRTYGNRREYCPSHQGYRERGRLITQAMAEHYAAHPAVIGWQIDNEFGARCYCPTCRAQFQAWLQKKYGNLEALNAAWGTAFWSHVYTQWDQIPAPAATGGVANPGLELDYDRFISDTYVGFQQEQVDIVRQRCAQHFVTHNFMGFAYDGLNYYDLARPLDLVAWDNYPRLAWHMTLDADPAPLALGHDTMRGLKGRSFWVMEEQSGSGGWQTVGVNPRPGEIRLWTYQAIAHGADAIVYFRWRTARHGTEQYWHGVLDHDGRLRRRYREVHTIGNELKKVGDALVGTESRAQAAMVLSYDSRFAFQAQPNHGGFSYSALFTSYYTALHRRNVAVDVVPPSADLSPYRLVLAPALHVLGAEAAANLCRYVEGGGTLVVTARSGVKDESNAVVDMPLPGLLARVCGVEVDEYDALPEGVTVPLSLDLPGPAGATPATHARLWCDVLTPTTAQTVGRYRGEYYVGQPAVTLNRPGQGQAVYVGTMGDATLHDALVGWLAEVLHLPRVLVTPEGVEAVERWRDRSRLLFLLNHADRERGVALPAPMRDLLTEHVVGPELALASKAVVILVEA